MTINTDDMVEAIVITPAPIEEDTVPEARPDQAPDVIYSSEDRTWHELTPAPDNVRGEITDASVADLADSIVARGLLQDITCHADGGIIYGYRRHHAIGVAIRDGRLEADYPISVMVATTPEGGRIDDGNLTLDRLVENLQREDINPIEEAMAMQSVIGYGFSQEQLAAQVGVTPGHVSKRLALLGLVDDFRLRVAAGMTTIETALLLAKLDPDTQYALFTKHKGHVSKYDIEQERTKQECAATKKKLVDELKALGHTVRSSTGPAAKGKMWVTVGNRTYAKNWDGKVPKTAEAVIVKQGQWAGSPEISFVKQIAEPEGREDLPSHNRGIGTEEEIKRRIERKQAEDAADAKRLAVRTAQAHVLLDQAKRLSPADFRKLMWQALVDEIVQANWMNDSTAKAVVEVAGLTPLETEGEIPERSFPCIKRVMLDEATTEAVRSRIVIACKVLGGDGWMDQAILDHAGFDPEAVEIPEPEPMSEEEAEAIADSVADDDLAEDLDDDFDHEDVTYEGTEHPEFDG